MRNYRSVVGIDYFCSIMSSALFSEYNISRQLHRSLDDMGFSVPTPIQEKCFSPIMAGRSMVGIAQTGTGKTLAYLLPLFNLWKFTKEPHPTMVVLVPTRELVIQVEEQARKLAAHNAIRIVGIYGGASINTQKEMLAVGVDLLVATPGRLIDLVTTGNLKLKNVKHLVIDEMDEMFGQGFRPQLLRIFDSLPKRRQNLLFSATITDDISEFLDEHYFGLDRVEAGPASAPAGTVEAIAYKVPNFTTKIDLLEHLLRTDGSMRKVLVFVSTIRMAEYLHERLTARIEEMIGMLHSNRAQNTRFRLLEEFADGKFKVLIATDLAGRGVDIEDVTHVVNFDLSEQAEDYVHRIGRTGRAGKSGVAISLISQHDRMQDIEDFTGISFQFVPLPDEIEFSPVVTEFDKPVIRMKNPLVEDTVSGAAFHEKKAKNMKVNMHMTREQKHKLKYGKPKSKGGNFKKK